MTNEVKHFDSLAIVLDDFDIWGGRTALSESDFKLGAGGELPPSAIASLGNKKIISSDRLRGFYRLKVATRRFLLRYGMPFLNGVAIPLDKLQEVTQKLDSISVEFDVLKDTFLQNYDTAIDDWVHAHPEYKDVILRNALSSVEVENRLKFEYQVFMVQSSNDPAQRNKLNQKVENLGEELLDEVAKTASNIYDKNFIGRMRCGVRAKNTLEQLREKIHGLAFLNGYLSPLVQMLDSALSLFDKSSNGFVEAPDFWYVSSVVLILSKRKTIAQYANGEIVVQETAISLQEQEPATSSEQPVVGGIFVNQLQKPMDSDTDPVGHVATNQTAQEHPRENINEALPKDVESDIDQFFNDFTSGQDKQPEPLSPAVLNEQSNNPVDETKVDTPVIEHKTQPVSMPSEAVFAEDEPTFF